MPKLTYKSSGVNYDLLDKLKRMAQIAGKETFNNLQSLGLNETTDSQGESAAVIIHNNLHMAFVQEGLGTKNLIAEAMFEIDGKTHYDTIAQDTIAMIVNDLITVGARPFIIQAYWAIGSEKWLENEQRMLDLVNGWKEATLSVGAIWFGGETPMLSGIINPDTVDLGGTCFGIIEDPSQRFTSYKSLQTDDAIVVFESSGIHANGITLARKLAESLSDGYATKLPNGRMYGEALLDPTLIYSRLIQDLFKNNIEIHYMANITGHGWRKLMRSAKQNLLYRITSLPPVPEVLQFIQKEAELDDTEAYGNFNMGAGFAIFVPQEHVSTIIEIATQQNIKAYHVGQVEEGEKQVIIEPKNIIFSADTLQVKA